MLLTPWIRHVKSRLKWDRWYRRNDRRRSKQETPKAAVELLEDRTLLSVSTLADVTATSATLSEDADSHTIDLIPLEDTSMQSLLADPDAGVAQYPLGDTFSLHSNPGASKVIYLDFDGHTTTGTAWNTSTGIDPMVTPAYDFDGDPSGFSDEELQRIQAVWDVVAEDYIPFDVDVTTEDPGLEALRNTGGTDTEWGVRVVIGPDQMSTGAGGIAYIGSFDWDSDTPCFVFNVGEKGVAEAASHEVGHTLGLSHDGDSTQGYYPGYGSGATGWAPIMGVGYSQELVQWSQGEYPDANNQEDDLDIIVTQNGFGYRTDDYGDSIATAASLGIISFDVDFSGGGIIERNTDVDYFYFTTDTGSINLDIEPYYRSPNLDILATLYDASGTPIATSNPTDALDASLSQFLTAGVYYVSIEGTGKAAVAGDPGYSDYGSLGQYSLTGSLMPGPTLVKVTANLISASGPDLITDGQIRTESPQELTFSFNPGQTIAPGPDVDISESAFSSITITRSGGDGTFEAAVAATDFGTSGATVVDFAAVRSGQAGNGVSLTFNTADLGASSNVPAITVSGDAITVTLNTNASKPTTATVLVSTLNAHAEAGQLVQATVRKDLLGTAFASTAVSGTTAVLDGANAAFTTTDFGTQGALEVRFTANETGPDANGIRVRIQKADRGGAGPNVSVDSLKRIITLTLDTNSSNTTTTQQAIDAINNSSLASQLITASLTFGSATTAVGTTATSAPTTLTLDGASDVVLVPGYVGVDPDSPNEVIYRFAETLPDDDYRIEIFGDGTDPADPQNTLQNTSGGVFNEGEDQIIDFQIDVGPQVVTVVPQPVVRRHLVTVNDVTKIKDGDTFTVAMSAGDALTFEFNDTTNDLTPGGGVQAGNVQIDIASSNTAMAAAIASAITGQTFGSPDVTANASLAEVTIENAAFDTEVNLTLVDSTAIVRRSELAQRTDTVNVYFNDDDLDSTAAENPTFYQLVDTRGTLDPADDVVLLPQTVSYDATADTASLKFSSALPDATFQLRVGYTRESDDTTATALNVGTIFDETDFVQAAFVGNGSSGLNDQDFDLYRFDLPDGTPNLTVTVTPDATSSLDVALRLFQSDGTAITTIGDANGVVDLNLAGATGEETFTITLDTATLGTVFYVGVSSKGNTSYSPIDSSGTSSGTTGSYRLQLDTTSNALTVDDNNTSFLTATDLGVLGAAGQFLSSQIEAQTSITMPAYPGGVDEPGHRDVPTEEYSVGSGMDAVAPDGIRVVEYNFQSQYGIVLGATVDNAITNDEENLARLIFEIYASLSGIEFVETPDRGITVVSGDIRAVDPSIQPGTTEGIQGTTALLPNVAIVDDSLNLDGGYGGEWFLSAMHQIGHAIGLDNTFDVPSVMGGYVAGTDFSTDISYDVDLQPGGTGYTGNPIEAVFPAANDIVQLQRNDRPDSTDIDMYRFEVQSAGTFTAEVFAERLESNSLLNSALTLFDADGNVVARNDDYYSNDSYIEIHLDPGVYFLGVTSTGNLDYDPQIAHSGSGGTTDGAYDLQFGVVPDVNVDEIQRLHTSGTVTGGSFTLTFDDGQTQDTTADIPYDATAAQVQSALEDLDNIEPGDVEVTGGALPGDPIDIRFTGNLAGRDVAEMVAASSSSDPLVGGSVDVMTASLGGVSQLVDSDNGATLLDGDADGQPGGVFEFAFQSGQTLFVNKVNLRAAISSTTTSIPVSDASLYPSGGGFTIRIDSEVMTVTGVNYATNTLTVAARTSGNVAHNLGATIVRPDADGSLSNPYGKISDALTKATFRIAAPGLGGQAIEDGDTFTITDTAHGTTVFEFNSTGGVDSGSDAAVTFTAGDTALTIAKAIAAAVRAELGNSYAPDPTDPSFTTPVVDLSGVTKLDVSESAGLLAASNLVRILGNPGADGELGTLSDNAPYLVGQRSGSVALADGSTFQVPQGATVMIDQGAVLKLRSAVIDVGTSAQNTDRSGGALQVLGTPDDRVSFDSYENDNIGGDSDGVGDGPAAGEWGGLVFRADSDFVDPNANTTDAGIWLNHVGFTNLTYGGGKVIVDGPEETFTPIHMIQSRPTIVYNNVTLSAQAAMSADPNAFDDSRGRMGPDIHNNTVTNNSINGLLIRIRTEAGKAIDRIEVSTVWDDTDIVHVVTENLEIEGNPGGPIDPDRYGLGSDPTARLAGRLAINPGTVVKLRASRIEALAGASNFIAEGTEENPIIFTSLQDDRFGAGGTFDTSNDASATEPAPGQWGGLIFNPMSRGSIDNALIAHGGGETPIKNGFAEFNVIEVHQASFRLTNSLIEDNADGYGTRNEADAQLANPSRRNGRGTNADATIFVRGAQPIIVNNTFVGNNQDVPEGQLPGGSSDADVITINANALVSTVHADYGRSRGAVEDFNEQFADNRGPMIRLNKMEDNGTNGLAIRGEELITETIWDDTDIVHVVRDEIAVVQFRTYGGLRLQSSSTESLVVKLYGDDAGFTALGVPLDIDDRIGGIIQVLGAPGFPVIFTSLNDDSVGAGLDPDGFPQTDTNNDGIDLWNNADPTDRTPDGLDDKTGVAFTGTQATPGDWRSIRLDVYSHDRNVRVVNEIEDANQDDEANGTSGTSQYLGELAPDLKSGDDNRTLGFHVEGYVREGHADDVDIYSFTAAPGTEVWIDIDRTGSSLDSMIELLDINGIVLATSNNSYDDPFTDTFNADDLTGIARPMTRDSFSGGDYYTINRYDPGMRVVLPDGPGGAGEATTYYIRVSSSGGATLTGSSSITFTDNGSTGPDTITDTSSSFLANGFKAGQQIQVTGTASNNGVYTIATVTAGTMTLVASDSLTTETLTDAAIVSNQTTGQYRLQVRLQQTQEIPGSTVRFADIRYATDGIEVLGLPQHSALTGESGEDTSDNNSFANAQELGDLLNSDLNTISVAGNLSNPNGTDVDFYRFEISYDQIQSVGGIDQALKSFAVVFDVDYADGLSRPDTVLSIFDSAGNLILIGRDSDIVDDQPAPDEGLDTDDLSRATFGNLDPFIGPVQMPTYFPSDTGTRTYYVAVSSNATLPDVLDQTFVANATNPLIRLEPVNSVVRVVEDHIGFSGYTTGNEFYDETLDVLPETESLFDLSSTITLDTNIVPFTLSDVVLFVASGGSSLATVDPFTGEQISWYGPNSISGSGYGYGDLAMRPDGTLYGQTLGPLNANSGNLREIDTGTAAQTNLGDDGVNTNVNVGGEWDAMTFRSLNNDNTYELFAVNNEDADDNNNSGDGLGYPAMIYRISISSGAVVDESTTASGLQPLGRGVGLPTEEQGREGDITGLAFGAVIGSNQLFAVDAGGNLFVTTVSGGTRNTAVSRSISDWTTVRLDITGTGVGFTGLSLGPQNVEDQRYADMFFATGTDGRLYAFDQTGVLQTVFETGNELQRLDTDSTVTDGVFTLSIVDPDGTTTTVTDVGGIDASTTTITVANASIFSAVAPNNKIRIDYEDMLVTNVDTGTNTLTVTRGINGTNAVVHAEGVTVIGIQTTDEIPYDVLANSHNEIQVLTNNTANSGDFELAFDPGGGAPLEVTTAGAIPYNATIAQVRNALNALPSLTGNILVRSVTGTNNLSQSPFEIEFINGLGDTDVAQLSVQDADSNLTPALPASITTTTQYEGNYGLESYLTDPAYITYVQTGDVTTSGRDRTSDPLNTPINIRFTLTDGYGDPIDIEPLTVNGTATSTPLAGGDVELTEVSSPRDNTVGDHYASLYSLGSTTGLAFSPLDFNLWHPTLLRSDDDGHGVNTAYDNTRDDPGWRSVGYPAELRTRYETEGGASFYFGLEQYLDDNDSWDDAYLDRYQANDAQYGIYSEYFQEDLTRNTEIGDNYNLPGGAKGSLVTNSFSLEGATRTDKPTLYFNYFLETENTNANNSWMRDSARVFISNDGGETWTLVATNNSLQNGGSYEELPEFDSASRDVYLDDPRQAVQELFDNTDSWRQARIDLADYAGESDLRLRFDFTTSGSMNDSDDPEYSTVEDGYGYSTNDFGNFNHIQKAQDNDHEGFYIDDIIVGFAERGEMVTGTTNSDPTTFFEVPDNPWFNAPVEEVDGPYQLEIRRGEEYISGQSGVGTAILDEIASTRIEPSLLIDTNTAQSDGFTLYAPTSSSIVDGQTFTVSDGLTSLVFEFDVGDSLMPTLSNDFDGISQYDSLPPDPTAAVGPGNLLAMVNSQIALFDKTTGAQIELTDLDASYGANAGFFEDVDSDFGSFDPWATYDRYSDCYIVMAEEVEYGTTFSGTGSMRAGYGADEAYLLIGVSRTDTPDDLDVSPLDADDDWYTYSIPAVYDFGNGLSWIDYPKITADQDSIYITGNYYLFGDRTFQGVLVTRLDKASMLSGTLGTRVDVVATGASTLQPVQSVGRSPSSPQLFADAVEGVGIRIWEMDDSNNLSVVRTVSSPFTTYTGSVSAGGATQPGSYATLDTLSSRLTNAVWRDNSLWTCHTVDVGGDATVRWYEIGTTNGIYTLIQTDDINPGSGIHTFMPGISVDAAGNMGMTYTQSSTNQFATMMYAGREASDPLGTTRPGEVVKASSTAYEPSGSGSDYTARWGDYAGIGLDPADDSTFWVFHEYAAASGYTWATHWGAFSFTGGGGSGGVSGDNVPIVITGRETPGQLAEKIAEAINAESFNVSAVTKPVNDAVSGNTVNSSRIDLIGATALTAQTTPENEDLTTSVIATTLNEPNQTTLVTITRTGDLTNSLDVTVSALLPRTTTNSDEVEISEVTGFPTVFAENGVYVGFFAGAPDRIQVSAGASFANFVAGQKVEVTGTGDVDGDGTAGDNDGVYTIASVGTTSFANDTLTLTSSGVLTYEVLTSGVRLRALPSVVDDDTTVNLVFNPGGTAPDTITVTGADFVQKGFTEGQQITVINGTHDGNTYTIAAVASGTLTLTTSTLSLEDAAAGVEVRAIPRTTTSSQRTLDLTIPAGASSITVSLDAVDDLVPDGSQPVQIVANTTASGFNIHSDIVDVLDSTSSAQLTVDIDGDARMTEADGTAALTASVTRTNAPLDQMLVVTLLSSDPSELQVPRLVTIPAGEESAEFSISAVDEWVSDGKKFVTVFATAFGFQSASVTVEEEPVDNVEQRDRLGDQNLEREQGQITIESNIITDVEGWGILVDAGARDNGSDLSHPGSVLNLPTLNTEQLAPGVTIVNNVVANFATGGILFSGDSNTGNVPEAAVPFGKIVNNTIYGGESQTGTGIQVEENASPTLINNIIANTTTGVSIDTSSTNAGTVVGSMLFQNNGNNGTVGSNAVLLSVGDALFVDPESRNFYLEEGSLAIDGSLDSLADRDTYVSVKDVVGVPNSDVFAPEEDLYGQKREDHPNPSVGIGDDVFKDIGAIERADFDGGYAELVIPVDANDNVEDLDLRDTYVRVDNTDPTELYTQLIVKLRDNGIGINDDLIGKDQFFLFQKGPSGASLLLEGTDYVFAYNANTNEAVFTSVGIFDLDRRYTLVLDNTADGTKITDLTPFATGGSLEELGQLLDAAESNGDITLSTTRGIEDLAGNKLQANRVDGTTVFEILLTDGVNDAPIHTVPSTQTVEEEGILVFSASSSPANAISVSDDDAFLGDGMMQVTLTALDESSAGPTSDVISIASITSDFNTSDAVLIQIGPLSTQFTGSDITINVASSDHAVSGASLYTENVSTRTITIDLDTDASNGGTNATTADDLITAITTNSTLIAAAVVSGDTTEVLGVPTSPLTLSPPTLTFNTGDGFRDSTMTFTGEINEVNEALEGLMFQPTQDFTGTRKVRIETDDQGNFPGPTAMTAVDDITINVTGVNDAPVNNVPGTQTVDEDSLLVFTGANAITATDVDAADGTGTMQIVLTAGNANDAVSLGAITSDFNTGGSVLIQFGPAAGQYTGGAITINVTKSDHAVTGNALYSEVVGTRTVNIDLDTDAGNGGVDATTAADLITAITNSSTLISAAIVGGDPTEDLGDETINYSPLTLNTPALTFTAGDGFRDQTMTFTVQIGDIAAALDGLIFEPAADFDGTTSLTITTDDQGNDPGPTVLSDTDQISITVEPFNDAPVLDLDGNEAGIDNTDLVYTENEAPLHLLDNSATLNDIEGDAITGGLVTLTNVLNGAEEVLAGVSDANITFGSYNSTTGQLSFTSVSPSGATLADTLAALKTVTYQNTSETPNTTARVITFQVTDDGSTKGISDPKSNSPAAEATVAVIPANDPPIVDLNGTAAGIDNSGVLYSEGDSPVTLALANATVTDADDTQADGATVTITSGFTADNGDVLAANTGATGISASYNSSTGILTLSGLASLADYQTVLRTVTYHSTSEDPTATSTTRTVSFVVTDVNSTGATNGPQTSNPPAVATVTITAVNDAPVVTTTGGAVSFTENDSTPVTVDAGVTVTDVDDTHITNGTVSLTGFTAGDVLEATTTGTSITASYDSGTGVLTLTGTDTLANYETVLRSVTFISTSEDPTFNGTTTPRTVTFEVTDANSDGAGAQSGSATRDINVTPLTDDPVLITTAGSTAYTENAAAVIVDDAVTVSDVDDTQLAVATVSITAGFTAGDVLEATTTGTSIVAAYNGTTGVLTLTGPDSLADYQAVLRSVTYHSTSEDPTETSTTRTVTFSVTDANSDGAGAGSDSATRGITITRLVDGRSNRDDKSGGGQLHGERPGGDRGCSCDCDRSGRHGNCRRNGSNHGRIHGRRCAGGHDDRNEHHGILQQRNGRDDAYGNRYGHGLQHRPAVDNVLLDERGSDGDIRHSNGHVHSDGRKFGRRRSRYRFGGTRHHRHCSE